MLDNPALLAALGTLFGIAITTAGSVLVARISRITASEATQQQGAFLLIAELRAEVDDLKAEVAALRDDLSDRNRTLWAAVSFIDRLGMWREIGSPPDRQPQLPSLLVDHINADLWKINRPEPDPPGDGQPRDITRPSVTGEPPP